MFKQIIAILFFAGLLFQNLSRFMILADYNLNKDYIANVLCENKSIPAMHCNGKCYLSKKLQEAAKEQSPGNHKTIPEIQLFFSSNKTDSLSRIGTLIVSAYGPYNNLPASTIPHNIFRPPVI